MATAAVQYGLVGKTDGRVITIVFPFEGSRKKVLEEAYNTTASSQNIEEDSHHKLNDTHANQLEGREHDHIGSRVKIIWI